MTHSTVFRIRRASRYLAAPAMALIMIGAAACSDTTQPTLPTVKPSLASFDKTNGPRIFFASDHEGTLQPYSMNADGSDVTKLPGNTPDGGWGLTSPDGKHVAYVSSVNFQIYLLNAGDPTPVQLTFDPGVCTSINWSKDSRQLVFLSTRDAANPANPSIWDFEIYKINIDGSGLTRLSFNKAIDTDPVWSPDGKYIAFASERDRDTDREELYVMDADGGNVKRLTFQSGVVQHPSWDPHSRRITFSTAFGNENGIYVADADGGNMTRLINDPSGFGAPILNFWPDWSPDGSKLVFVSVRDGNQEIYTMNPDGSAQTRLTFSPGYDNSPRWSR